MDPAPLLCHLLLITYAIVFTQCVNMTGERTRRWVALSHKEKQAIVDKHNALRRREGAADMMKMRWSEGLAELGARWAQRCRWEHGQPSSVGQDRSVGQNLYITTRRATDTTSVDAIQSWYDEIKHYYYYSGRCSKVCGHYTQIVWARSREVGCGYHVCSTIRVKGRLWENAYYLVCNYSPAYKRAIEIHSKTPARVTAVSTDGTLSSKDDSFTLSIFLEHLLACCIGFAFSRFSVSWLRHNLRGNYVGQRPYKKGYGCSACPDDMKFCDNGLCSDKKPLNSAGCLLPWLPGSTWDKAYLTSLELILTVYMSNVM